MEALFHIAITFQDPDEGVFRVFRSFATEAPSPKQRVAALTAIGYHSWPEFLPVVLRDRGGAGGAGAAFDFGGLTAYIHNQLRAGSTTLYADYQALTDRHLLTEVLRHTGGNLSQASRLLGITLTRRDGTIPMAGVPHHAVERYLAKLLRKGFKVAICEQMEDPKGAKKLVRREVTRVLTPGTAADKTLASEENKFLAALARSGERIGLAALDLSTGEFRATEFPAAAAADRSGPARLARAADGRSRRLPR